MNGSPPDDRPPLPVEDQLALLRYALLDLDLFPDVGRRPRTTSAPPTEGSP